jgi:hypothetical protein
MLLTIAFKVPLSFLLKVLIFSSDDMEVLD